MPLSPGTRLGSYEGLSSLGEGGMGEVYRARDARLQRDVAIKVLPVRWTRRAAGDDGPPLHASTQTPPSTRTGFACPEG